ncbi:hypothetical protein OMW55_04355 [Sphingomonas sp. BN140010]|uniref:Transmembrane protein n=1 Tax=Sphingomonas arvum TaxID=2992113 RepID=A0ABT3JDY8_9SPHN|nr:hypothetical protein [Sphingomonas sp. BN140010]MCW3797036.1 hypothetical protein [Sphingomonas sp. BN140010]
MLWLLLAVVAHLVFSMMLVGKLHRAFPAWGKGRLVSVAALPMPLLIWGACSLLLLKVLTSTAEECRADACGTSLLAVAYASACGLVLFLLGAACAAFVSRRFAASPAASEPRAEAK